MQGLPQVLITIRPSDRIVFKNVNGRMVSELVICNNSSLSSVAYKIKTTTPKGYQVRPSSGTLFVGKEALIEISLTGTITPEQSRKDKFQIQAIEVPFGEPNFKVKELWHTQAADTMQQIRLSVDFEDIVEEVQSTIGSRQEIKIRDVPDFGTPDRNGDFITTTIIKKESSVEPQVIRLDTKGNSSVFNDQYNDSINSITVAPKASSNYWAGTSLTAKRTEDSIVSKSPNLSNRSANKKSSKEIDFKQEYERLAYNVERQEETLKVLANERQTLFNELEKVKEILKTKGVTVVGVNQKDNNSSLELWQVGVAVILSFVLGLVLSNS